MGETPVGTDHHAFAGMVLHGEGEQPVSGQHAGALRENRREIAEIDEDIGATTRSAEESGRLVRKAVSPATASLS